MLMCLQCTMRALINNEQPPSFDETSEEHMKRVHPDPIKTLRERNELEQQLKRRLEGGNK